MQFFILIGSNIICFLAHFLFVVLLYLLFIFGVATFSFVQSVEQAAFTARIQQYNERFHEHCRKRLTKRFKNFKIVFEGCYPMFINKWFGYMDGQSKFGETFHLNFNQDKSKYDTGLPNAGTFAPIFVIRNVLNNGQDIEYAENGFKYTPVRVRIRNVGNQGKCEFSGTFKKLVGNQWKSV